MQGDFGAAGWLIVEVLGRVAYSSRLLTLKDGLCMNAAPIPADLTLQVARALEEDVGSGDLTAALIPAATDGWAAVITRESAIICGAPYVDATFAALDPRTRIHWKIAEGAAVEANQTLFEIQGPARSLLTRRAHGTQFPAAPVGYRDGGACLCRAPRRARRAACSTRARPSPACSSAQKYAVRVGGGHNHRMGLFDGILIKENHIMAAGSIARAVAAARATGTKVPVEVEVETLDELEQAIAAGADIALLDDFSLEDMAEAVAINRAPRAP